MTNWLWWNVGYPLWKRWAKKNSKERVINVYTWMSLDWSVKR